MLNKLLVVATLAACIATALPLPKGFIGHWTGVPEYTSVGPHMISSGGINFTVHVIDDYHWLMEDSVGRAVSMKNSQQQFWISSPKNDTLGGATYCGWLAGYYLTMPQHGKVCDMKMTKMTDKALTFKYTKSMQDTARLWLPWSIEWWLVLSDDGKYINLWIDLPSGPEYSVKHLKVNLTLVSRDTTAYQSETVKAHLKAKTMAPPCNFTKVPTPMPPALKEGTPEYAKHVLHEDDLRLRCPHGFTEKDGPMPDFVKKMVAARKAERARRLGKLPDSTEAAKPLVDEVKNQIQQQQSTNKKKVYDWCVRLNAYHNLTIQLTNNDDTNTTDVKVSGIPRAQTAAESWIAVGIMPAWPSMFGMDIVLGYFVNNATTGIPTSCVRSMYAKHNVGLPIANPNQTILNGRMSISGENNQYINLEFTRPWKTGNWDLSEGPMFPKGYKFIPIPVSAWAIGRAPATCDGVPIYHGPARGTHGFSWANPETAVIPESWCDPKTVEV